MSIFESVKCSQYEGAEHHEGGRAGCCGHRQWVLLPGTDLHGERASRLRPECGRGQGRRNRQEEWSGGGNSLCKCPEWREKVDDLKTWSVHKMGFLVVVEAGRAEATGIS